MNALVTDIYMRIATLRDVVVPFLVAAAWAPSAHAIEGYERIVATRAETVPAAETVTHVAACSPGKVVVGGGASADEGRRLVLKGSYPSTDSTWFVKYTNSTDAAVSTVIYAFAICVQKP